MTQPLNEPRTLLFQTPARVIDGTGAAARLPRILAEFGARRALIITGPTVAAETALLWYLEQLLGEWHVASYSGASAGAGSESVAEAAGLARQAGADILVSVGGGRAIDLAKATGQALATTAARVRHVAIPTTLAGAAFTSPAVLSHGASEGESAAALWAEERAADAVLLDPRLTVETPAELWQRSGAATMRHAERTLAFAELHPFTGTLTREAIRLLTPALIESAANPSALPPRGEAQLAVLMAYAAAADSGRDDR